MGKLTRWHHLLISTVLLGGLLGACSFIFDHDDNQCETRDDCVNKGFTGTPTCEQGVCVATGLGPEGCFVGTPTTPEDFANQCTNAQCEKYDNCAKLGLCGENPETPAAIPPPDAAASVPVDAMFPTQMCVETGAENTTIVVAGSSAIAGFLQTVAPLVGTQGFRLAYSPAGSCVGVDGIFSTDAAKHLATDRAGTTSVLFPLTGGGAGVPCSWGAGATIDVGASDVFSTSCNAAYTVPSNIADFQGPIQPMTFVVPSASENVAISAEAGHIVFGRGAMDEHSAPWDDATLHFVRNASSGTQQMLSRAISVAADQWWGKNSGSTGGVVTGLTSVAPAVVDKVIGIMGTDGLKSADTRRNIRVLAFQATGQLCGFYPDRIPASLDKQNVRDGHYPIWGPVHFYTAVTGGTPTAKAGALVTRFSLPGIDQTLLDAIITGGVIPQCAMKVSRDTEMGPLKAYSPPFQCGCYFESKLADNSTPTGCTACTSTNDCPAAAPACNLGFCEAR
ncbi:MAG TPA: hypothetical protein VGM90_39340 [Kofleriaceae bacterium]|jgi:ABC-type phosphate transport system substrate-binding protein